jgi:hypothetical protein
MSLEPRIDVFDPRHNARQAAKELVLLEDHLRHPPQHCPDCVRKHLLKAEAYADEGVSLAPHGSMARLFDESGAVLRGMTTDYTTGSRTVAHRRTLAEQARQVRKRLAKAALRPSRAPSASRSGSPNIPSFNQGADPLADVGKTAHWHLWRSGGAADLTADLKDGSLVFFLDPRFDPTAQHIPLGDQIFLQRGHGWEYGRVIGPGNDKAAQCQVPWDRQPSDLDQPLQITSVVSDPTAGAHPDPTYNVVYVNSVTTDMGVFDRSPQCLGIPVTQVVPRARFADAFPPRIWRKSWNKYAPSGDVQKMQEGFVDPKGKRIARGRWLQTKVIQGVVDQKLPDVCGWMGSSSRGCNNAIKQVLSQALILYAGELTALDPTAVLDPWGDSTKDRVGLLPFPRSDYPAAGTGRSVPVRSTARIKQGTQSYATPEGTVRHVKGRDVVEPSQDPVVSVLIALKKLTENHTDPNSVFSLAIGPLVQAQVQRRHIDLNEWIEAVGASLFDLAPPQIMQVQKTATDLFTPATPATVLAQRRAKRAQPAPVVPPSTLSPRSSTSVLGPIVGTLGLGLIGWSLFRNRSS